MCSSKVHAPSANRMPIVSASSVKRCLHLQADSCIVHRHRSTPCLYRTPPTSSHLPSLSFERYANTRRRSPQTPYQECVSKVAHGRRLVYSATFSHLRQPQLRDLPSAARRLRSVFRVCIVASRAAAGSCRISSCSFPVAHTRTSARTSLRTPGSPSAKRSQLSATLIPRNRTLLLRRPFRGTLLASPPSRLPLADARMRVPNASLQSASVKPRSTRSEPHPTRLDSTRLAAPQRALTMPMAHAFRPIARQDLRSRRRSLLQPHSSLQAIVSHSYGSQDRACARSSTLRVTFRRLRAETGYNAYLPPRELPSAKPRRPYPHSLAAKMMSATTRPA